MGHAPSPGQTSVCMCSCGIAWPRVSVLWPCTRQPPTLWGSGHPASGRGVCEGRQPVATGPWLQCSHDSCLVPGEATAACMQCATCTAVLVPQPEHGRWSRPGLLFYMSCSAWRDQTRELQMHVGHMSELCAGEGGIEEEKAPAGGAVCQTLPRGLHAACWVLVPSPEAQLMGPGQTGRASRRGRAGAFLPVAMPHPPRSWPQPRAAWNCTGGGTMLAPSPGQDSQEGCTARPADREPA